MLVLTIVYYYGLTNSGVPCLIRAESPRQYSFWRYFSGARSWDVPDFFFFFLVFVGTGVGSAVPVLVGAACCARWLRMFWEFYFPLSLTGSAPVQL